MSVDMKVASDRTESRLETVAALTNTHVADDSSAIFKVLCP